MKSNSFNQINSAEFFADIFIDKDFIKPEKDIAKIIVFQVH